MYSNSLCLFLCVQSQMNLSRLELFGNVQTMAAMGHVGRFSFLRHGHGNWNAMGTVRQIDNVLGSWMYIYSCIRTKAIIKRSCDVLAHNVCSTDI